MRVLITGASSLPGFRTVLKALSEGYSVLGLYKEHKISMPYDNFASEKVDIRDYNRLKSIFEKFRPTLIIHMAALGDVDLCEKNKKLAWEINVLGTLNVMRLASKYSEFLLYLSTDYVFDGERGNYDEEEVPNPVNYYGFTKLVGEIICMSANIPSAIVRSSSLYGFGSGRKNFAKFLIENLKSGKTVRALVDQYTSPTEATLLGEAVMEIVDRKLTGIFHVVGERMSRFEFALKVAEALNLDKSLILKDKMSGIRWYAKRPKDSSLDFKRTRNILKTNFYSTARALKMLRDEYLEVEK